jgi:Zn-dependent peptidase ImmA (M78 family)/transcriptional regulator with XRE-family HTH domain
MDKKANPTMIILARESRGKTQSELAKDMENRVSQATLSKIEQCLKDASEDVIREIAVATNYPVDFFYEDHYAYPPHMVYHRKRKSLTKSLQMKIDAETNIRLLHLKKLLLSVDIPELNLPIFEYDQNVSPIGAAKHTRAFYKCPRGPVVNVVDILEKAGIIIIQCDLCTPKMDGFTMHINGLPPTIFINKDLTGDRERFTLCHEAAHILLHLNRSNPIEDTDADKEADTFASEFLMPEDEIRPYLTGITLAKLASLKRLWKVSMASLLMRAKTLSMLSERMLRQRWMELSQYKTREPLDTDIPIEKPQTIHQLINIHKTELDYTNEDFAKLFRLSLDEFQEKYELGRPKLKLYR